jgi:hypothetical protein
MGFDLIIHMDMEIDVRTGLPFVYYVNQGFLDKKPYDPQELRIPDKYLKYVEQRGHHFHSYVKMFNGATMSARPKDFIAVYPNWDDVKNENQYMDDEDEYWGEKEHIEFKEFLEWMDSKSPCISIFEIHWSY